jgi:hypothetical protein
MLRVKFFEVSMTELPRGVTLTEQLDKLVNEFLAEKAHAEIVRTHMNSVSMPAEDGGGMYRETPASVVVILALFYRG